MHDIPACLGALSDAIGRSRILTERADLESYEQDARYGAGRAAFVLLPQSTEEVSTAVRLCLRHGVSIVAQGANTGLVKAASPDTTGQTAIISLNHLKAAPEVDPFNRSARVLAGVRLSELNAALEPYGLVLPIDLGADPSIGGMVATNTGGARLLRYGDMRRSILGLEVVLPDCAATILDLSKGLRKNNTGLDLKHLFIGTGGALGIVTKVELEVQALPKQRATAMMIPSDRTCVPQILHRAEKAFGEMLTCFEGMSRNAMEAAITHLPRVRNPFAPNAVPEYAILCEVTSTFESHSFDLQSSLMAFLEAELSEGVISNAVADHIEELWVLRHSISESLRHVGRIIGLDISVRRAQLPDFHAEAYELVHHEFPWLRICDFGHSGDGGDHFNLVWPHGCERPYDETTAVRAREAIYRLVVYKYGGSFSAEHGVGPHNQRYYDEFVGADQRAIAGRLAAAINPTGLLGRVRLD